MIYRYTTLKSFSYVLLLVLIIVSGCGKSYELAEVDGVLLINGKPGHKIHLQFIPENAMGMKAPPSEADTDKNGNFTLQILEKDGAYPPWSSCRYSQVVLNDLQLAESATGAGIPIRLKQEWSLAGSTPLKQEIKPGKQTIEIKIP